MLIPWPLVVSLMAAVAVGGLVAHRMGQRPTAVADVVLSAGLPALVAARLAVILRDAVLSDGFPPLLAWVNIGAGLSLPVGLAALLLAGARAQRKAGKKLSVVAVTASWAGMVTFAALSVYRGEGLGVAFRLPWPQAVSGTAVPVGVLEGVVLAGALWWARRRYGGDAGRYGAAFVAVMATVHLLGGVLRPSLATPDRDLDTLLGVGALVLAVAVVRGVPARRLRMWVGGVVAVVGLLVAGVVVGAPFGSPVVATPLDGSLEGAMVVGGEPQEVPAWGGTELAGFAADEGGLVVVNLWASWCPPCHAEAPAVARAAQALEGEVAFLGVLVDDEPGRAQDFVDRYDLPFPTVIDDGITAAVGSPGLPTTVVLGPDGEVRERAVGGVDDRSLAAMLDRAGR